jgi:hypothetical protein
MAHAHPEPRTVAELLARIEAGWTALNDLVGRLDEAQLTAPGADGWSIVDHLAHLAAWERSVIGLLRGQPRHAAMGIDRDTYERGFDAANAAIQARSAGRSLADVRAEVAATHQEVLALLAGLTDADLVRTYSSFQPNEPGEDSGAPVLNWIAGNTYDHYREHLDWIGRLVV